MIKPCNRTYVLREHSHITQAIVLVDSPEPLDQGESDVLDELEKLTDLHFLFLPKATPRIDPKKFSEAWSATGYTVSTDPTGIQGLLWTVDYDRELFQGQHLYYFVILPGQVRGTSPDTVRRFIENSEVLRRSVFKVQRLSAEALAASYLKSGSWWKPVDRVGTYTTHTIEQPEGLLLYRPELHQEIQEFLMGKPGYRETFPRIPDFLGSLTVRLRDPELILNMTPSDVKIGTDRV